MAGREGQDYFVGNDQQRQVLIDDAKKRTENYLAGCWRPTQDDVMRALKILDGKYSWWEESEARAILQVARATNPGLKFRRRFQKTRRRYGIFD